MLGLKVSIIAKQFGQVVEIEDLSIQKLQTHIARVCITISTTSFQTINEVVRLQIQGLAFPVRVLEDMAVIIDFGRRYSSFKHNYSSFKFISMFIDVLLLINA